MAVPTSPLKNQTLHPFCPAVHQQAAGGGAGGQEPDHQGAAVRHRKGVQGTQRLDQGVRSKAVRVWHPSGGARLPAARDQHVKWAGRLGGGGVREGGGGGPRCTSAN